MKRSILNKDIYIHTQLKKVTYENAMNMLKKSEKFLQS